MADDKQDPLMTIREVAQVLSVHPRTVHRRARESWLGFPPLLVHGPKSFRINRKALEEWMEQEKVLPPVPQGKRKKKRTRRKRKSPREGRVKREGDWL